MVFKRSEATYPIRSEATYPIRSEATYPIESSGRHNVEAEAEGDADLSRVERDEAHRAGKPLGGSQVDCIGQPHGLLSGEACGAVETPLVHGHHVQIVPSEAYRVFEIGSHDGLIGEAINRRQCFGEREGGRTPHRIGIERSEDYASLFALDGERQQRAGVEHHRHVIPALFPRSICNVIPAVRARRGRSAHLTTPPRHGAAATA